jgi:hypothetical protein
MREKERDQGKDCSAAHPVPKGAIIKCAKGSYVDLSNMPSTGTTLASIDMDTASLRNPMVKLDFSCSLSYTLSMLEELDLIFVLYRQDNNKHKNEPKQLTTWPFKILMDQTLTTETTEAGEAEEQEDQYAYIILGKDETITFSYCDQPGLSSDYTYSIAVNANYYFITSAVITSSFLSATAQSCIK